MEEVVFRYVTPYTVEVGDIYQPLLLEQTTGVPARVWMLLSAAYRVGAYPHLVIEVIG